MATIIPRLLHLAALGLGCLAFLAHPLSGDEQPSEQTTSNPERVQDQRPPALPWDADIFDGSPASIQRSIQLSEGQETPSDYLLFSQTVEILSDHRVHRQYDYVYVIRNLDEIETRGTVRAEWNPWLHKRPQVRARITTTRGQVHELDATTLIETAAENVDASTFRNNRILTGPLPAVEIGAVVELRIRTEEHRAFCDQGVMGHLALNTFVDTESYQLKIHAASEVPLRIVTSGDLGDTRVHRTEKGQTWRYETRNAAPVRAFWNDLPRNVSNRQYATYSTATSWQAIASYYRDVVNTQIEDADLSQLPDEFTVADMPPMQRIDAACRVLRNAVRYTGIEFGAGAIVPRKPAETLRRRYGDCKDQSSLLVAMLKQHKIAAHVALVAAELENPHADSPGLNAFDHVIVHIPKQPGVDEAFWIDPTSPYTTIGELPAGSQGRSVLIVSAGSRTLLTTPSLPASQNAKRAVAEYQLNADGLAAVRTQSTMTGFLAAFYREYYSSKDWKTTLQQLGEQTPDAPAPTLVTSDPQATSKGQLEATITYSTRDTTFENEGVCGIFLNFEAAFGELPYQLLHVTDDDAIDVDIDTPEREHPFRLSRPMHYHRECRVIPPPGFVVHELPDPFEFSIGEFRIQLKVKEAANREVVVTFRLETGDQNITVDQSREISNAIARMTDDTHVAEWRPPVAFLYAPHQQMMNDAPAAIRTIKRHSNRYPETLFYRAELAKALVQVGLMEEAREIAQEAIDADPESFDAHNLAGWIHLHNRFGDSLSKGMNRQAAQQAFKQAVALDPSNYLTQYNLTLLQEHDDAGRRFETDSEALDRARLDYRKNYEASGLDLAMRNYRMLSLRAGDTRALKRLLNAQPYDLHNNAFYLAGVASKRGMSTALRTMNRSAITVDQHDALLSTTASLLRAQQRYDLFREFVMLKRSLFPSAELLMQLTPFEENVLPAEDPASALQAMLALWMFDAAEKPEFRQLFSSADPDSLASERNKIPKSLAVTREACRDNFTSLRVARDTLSLYQFSAKGDDANGYVVKAKPIVESWESMQYLVVHQDNQYRLFVSGKDNEQIGRRAQQLLQNGKIHATVQWLDFVYDEERSDISIFDAFAGTPFARTWSIIDKRDTDHLQLVALMLASRGTPTAQHYDKLNAMRPDLPSVWQLQIDRARCRILIDLGRFEEAVELTQQLVSQNRNSFEPIGRQLAALFALEQFQDAEQVLASVPSQYAHAADNYRCELMGRQSGHSAVVLHCVRQLRNGQVPDHIYAAYGWRSLFVNHAAKALTYKTEILNAHARFAASDGGWHTIACLYADAGKLVEAVAAMQKAVALRGDQFDPIDNWILGRISEHCGMQEAAKKYYRKVQPSKIDTPTASCWELAQLRLKAIANTKDQVFKIPTGQLETNPRGENLKTDVEALLEQPEPDLLEQLIN